MTQGPSASCDSALVFTVEGGVRGRGGLGTRGRGNTRAAAGEEGLGAGLLGLREEGHRTEIPRSLGWRWSFSRSQAPSLPSLISWPCPVLQVWPRLGIGPGPFRIPPLPAWTVNSSPRSHNARAEWCGAALGPPLLLPPDAWGWEAGGPSSLFQGGGHSVSTVSVFPSPGLPIQARGHACLGDPCPPQPPSVSLSVSLLFVQDLVS